MALAVISLALSLFPKSQTRPIDDVQPDDSETKSIVFRADDSGETTAANFIRAYSRNLAPIARNMAAEIAKGEKDSMTLAKEWVAASQVAREEASKGVNARVAELVKQSETDRTIATRFLEEAAMEFERRGK